MNKCCFTGHRSYKLGLDDRGTALLRAKLDELVAKLIDEGITVFYTGMAEGVDMWAAQSALKQKELHPEIKLLAAVPCLGQDRGWKQADKELYKHILAVCDEVYNVSEKYTPDCFFKRNRYMVDNSDCVLAVYNGKGGGTGYTVDYAREKGKRIILVNPEKPES